MKRYFSSSLILISLMGLHACSPKGNHDGKIDTQDVNISATADGTGAKGMDPVMTFTTELHDFGKITQGERVKYAFKFKNTGGSELIISDAHGSCGCTVPEIPKKPVAPGEEAVIGVEFNSEGKRGMNEKTVTIISNANPHTKVITIKAEVMVPETKK
ncbi:MAG TPA: DUF1573 domain-containing protein [Bacteroidia bacterium]|jgi:hypothetical protein|nr:DUF1573 domain-containing protein [Bacteroidia bacterium]